MRNIESLRSELLAVMPHLKDHFRVKEIGIFGSFARGEQDDRSDIDLLVDYADDTISLFDVIELKDYLEGRLGIAVDIVTRRALKPNIGKRILEEVKYL